LIAKILHIVLGFFLLIGATGFTVKKHYCQHQLESVSFLPTKGCCKSKSHKTCKKANSGCKKGCCNSELAYFHSDDVQETQEVEIISLEETPFTTSPILSVWSSLKSDKFRQYRSFLTYKPPIVQRDISTLFRVFRL
jgi:hypothetical protein